jgi:hypothetical protein
MAGPEVRGVVPRGDDRYRIQVTRTTPGRESCVADLEGWVPLDALMMDVTTKLVEAGLMEEDDA